MSDTRDFLPVFAETLARIRARMDADANAGLLPSDAAWIDTREGSFYWDMTQVTALEIARLWDAIGSETVAAAFPATAWGEYLDDHAATFGLTRNPAVQAVGDVLFVGAPGTLIATNVEVSAPPSDPSLDAVTFKTTASGETSDLLPSPAGVTATPSGTGGTLPAGTYIYHVTAYNEFGETTGSADVSATVTGSTSSVVIAWAAVSGALGYRVYRTVNVMSLGGLIADTDLLAFTDTGAVAPGTLEPTENGTSGVILPVQCVQAGGIGDLGAGAITTLGTLIPAITLVTNPSAIEGGEDVEDDDALRRRVLAQYSGQGGGNQQDYVRWSLAFPGVERCVCIPVWAGPQTVLVIPMLSDGSAVTSDIVDGLQTALMPIAVMGVGEAPIGAIVTVTTTVPLDVAITATLTFAPAFSLDGLSGTVATRAEITDALSSYLLTLNPGDTIVYERVQSLFFSVEGVIAVTGLTINTGTADVTLGTSPPQYPRLTAPALT